MTFLKTTLVFFIAVTLSILITKQLSNAADAEIPKLQRFVDRGEASKVYVDSELLDSIQNVGKVVGAFKPSTKFATDDSIYLKFPKTQVSVGDKFLIYKSNGGVKVPGSFFKYVGDHVEYKGVVQVTSVVSETVVGRIIESSDEINIGDQLTPWRDLNVDIKPQEPMVDVRGKVIGSAHRVELMGPFETGFINLGSKSGLKINDRLYVYMTGDGNKEITKGLPEVPTAELVVVSLAENYSTFYVLSAIDRVEIGNHIKSAREQVKFLETPSEASPDQSRQ